MFFDEWHILPGDVVVHQLDAAIRASANAILLISPASGTSPRALEEYAALATAGAQHDLRFIPVLVGDVDLPPFAANRVWRDFRNIVPEEYELKVEELAAVVRGAPPDPALPEAGEPAAGSVSRENIDAALPSSPRPVTEPERPALVVCYASADLDYAQALIGQLRADGLTVWSVGDLRPGDAQFWSIRQQLTYATAVVVLMSPQSQDSDDITRMILEGLRHERPFFPVLLDGERNYHLAHTWYVDARDGRLLSPHELEMLRRLDEAAAEHRPLDPATVLPAPLESPPVRAVRVPASVSLDRLHHALCSGELEHADLLTTALVLEAADRLDDGWMRERHARGLPLDVLAGIDAVWSAQTQGRQGFRAQAALAGVRAPRHADFLALSVACGWRGSVDDSVSRHYREFAELAGPGRRTGFFPTLRNPQSEGFPDWYDQWMSTVLATHLRLRNGGS